MGKPSWNRIILSDECSKLISEDYQAGLSIKCLEEKYKLGYDIIYKKLKELDIFEVRKNFNPCKGAETKNFIGYKEISGTFWSTIRNNAATRNIDFNLTIEEAWDLFQGQNEHCALSGEKITLSASHTRNRKENTTASLDRKDSKLGYFKENCQWIHKKLNCMKMDTPENEFFYIISLIYQNRINPSYNG